MRAIATAWRCPPDICRTRWRGRVSDFSSANSSPARLFIAAWSSQRIGPNAALDLAAEKDIGRRGQIVAEGEILIDDLDAFLARLDRPVEMDRLAVEHDFTAMTAESCRR